MTQNPGVEVHLPCPPLREWLARRLEGMRVGAWAPTQAPRRVRGVLQRWPTIGVDAEPTLDALVFGVSLERPEPPESALAELRDGALIVELAVPRARVVRSLLGLEGRPRARAAQAQARALQWLGRGCFALEQWESVEPQGVVVTFARTRRGP